MDKKREAKGRAPEYEYESKPKRSKVEPDSSAAQPENDAEDLDIQHEGKKEKAL